MPAPEPSCRRAATNALPRKCKTCKIVTIITHLLKIVVEEIFFFFSPLQLRLWRWWWREALQVRDHLISNSLIFIFFLCVSAPFLFSLKRAHLRAHLYFCSLFRCDDETGNSNDKERFARYWWLDGDVEGDEQRRWCLSLFSSLLFYPPVCFPVFGLIGQSACLSACFISLYTEVFVWYCFCHSASVWFCLCITLTSKESESVILANQLSLSFQVCLLT